MQSNTHISSSVSISLLPFLYYPSLFTSKEIALLYISGVALGSLFPDIDEPESSIGRYVSKLFPFIPKTINYFFGHRGLTHKFIFFLLPLSVLFIYKESINIFVFIFLFSFLIGILMHQIGDMLSGSKRFKGGIKDYFYPITNSGKYFTPFPKIIRCAVWDFKEKIYNLLFLALFVYEVKMILLPKMF